MFEPEVNYKPTDTSTYDEISYSDVENVSTSPDNSMLIIANAEQLSIDERLRNDDTKSWTMVKVHVGYDVTRKGERSLVVNGYKFTKSREGTNNRVFWRCSRRECKATAVTVSDRVEHVRAVHGHEPPLASEFVCSHEGVKQNCELQDVRFNTNVANMRSRCRRSNLSVSETNPEMPITVKDISNASNNYHNNHSPSIDQNSPSVQSRSAFSVKDQVRDFILRNSQHMTSHPQNKPVGQLLISPTSQSAFTHIHNNNSTVVSSSSSQCNNSTVVSSSSSRCNNSISTAINFNPMIINPVSGSGSIESISNNSSYNSRQLTTTLRHDIALTKKSTRNTTTQHNGQTNIEQIIQLLLKNGSCTPRSTPCDSDWSSPTADSDAQQFNISQQIDTSNSPSAAGAGGVQERYQAPATSRFVHWKKEKLRDSEIGYKISNDRKRRCEDYQSEPLINTTSASDTKQLRSFLSSFCPTITNKLVAIIEKLTSELCPENVVAQEVFEKCTAIKTCLETLEKFHSLTRV